MQFWVQYDVLHPTQPPCELFFKMFINGRHITSWGINPLMRASGTVKRAFYEPGERWHYTDGGRALKREGIESRYFHFVPGPETKSVAEDGGLIEVYAFRASARKKRAVLLDQYRSQERYRIA